MEQRVLSAVHISHAKSHIEDTLLSNVRRVVYRKRPARLYVGVALFVPLVSVLPYLGTVAEQYTKQPRLIQTRSSASLKSLDVAPYTQKPLTVSKQIACGLSDRDFDLRNHA